MTQKLTDQSTNKIINQNFDQIRYRINISQFIGAVGVLRITRKRLEKFYASNISVKSVLHDENNLLDKIYFKAALIQRRIDKAINLYGELEKVILKEKLLAEILNEKRENFRND